MMASGGSHTHFRRKTVVAISRRVQLATRLDMRVVEDEALPSWLRHRFIQPPDRPYFSVDSRRRQLSARRKTGAKLRFAQTTVTRGEKKRLKRWLFQSF